MTGTLTGMEAALLRSEAVQLLTAERDAAREALAAVTAERDVLRERNTKLAECLQWFIDNDETIEGDEPLDHLGGLTWSEMNAYWLAGRDRARAVLKELTHAE